ncbi:hypothetical protein [Crossiella sp. NPDC003009]
MTTTPQRTRTHRPALAVPIAAWAFPVFVLGGFGLLSGFPVLVLLIGTLRDPRLRALRWWSAASAVAYATPLAFWLLGSSDAPSLTKFMNPVVTGIVIAVGVVVAIAHLVHRGRSVRMM